MELKEFFDGKLMEEIVSHYLKRDQMTRLKYFRTEINNFYPEYDLTSLCLLQMDFDNLTLDYRGSYIKSKILFLNENLNSKVLLPSGKELTPQSLAWES